MTSKHLFIKLLREDAKRRLWSIVLLSLVWFCCFPVMTSMYVTNLRSSNLMLRRVCGLYGADSMVLIFIAISAALVLAFHGFHYLHSVKMTDFYHSQPIRRGKLFAVVYCDGILIFAGTYLIGLLVSFCILAANGLDLVILSANLFYGYLFVLMTFLLFYSLAVVAAQLVGKTLIAVLGVAYLSLYPIVIYALKDGLMSLFFDTYVSTFGESALNSTKWLSPVSLITMNIESMGTVARSSVFYGISSYWGLDMPAQEITYTVSKSPLLVTALSGLDWLLMLLMFVVLAAVAFFLSQKRRSETAGHSFAFHGIAVAFKFFTAIPAAAGFGIFFYVMNDFNTRMTWFFFGVVFGAVLTLCAAEVIIQSDIKAAICKKKQLLLGTVLSVLFCLGFSGDWFGYDRYLPEKSKLESVSVGFGFDYDLAMYDLDSVNLKYDYDYQETKTEYTNLELAYPLLEYVVKNTNETMESDGKDTPMAVAVQVDGSTVVTLNDSIMNTYYSMSVTYHKKDGGEVRRSYTLDLSDSKLFAMVSAIYEDMEYKENSYPLYTAQLEKALYGVRTSQYWNGGSCEDQALALEFLEIYRKEFGEMTLQEMLEGSCLAELHFLVNGLGTTYFYYPLYASFTESIAWLEEQQMLEKPSADQVLYLQVSDSHSGQTYEFDQWEDSEIISKLWDKIETYGSHVREQNARYYVYGIAIMNVQEMERLKERYQTFDYNLFMTSEYQTPYFDFNGVIREELEGME